MRRLAIIVLVLVCSAALLAQSVPGAKSGYFLTSDHVKLHYLEKGSGPTIVLVPGWTMPAWIWAPQFEALSGKFHVVALDPRSQGESEKPGYGDYLSRRSQDIVELLAHLKAQKPVVVGWSLGVPEVAYAAGKLAPESFGGVVFVDGFLADAPDGKAQMEMMAWQETMMTDRKMRTTEFVRSMFRKPQPPAYEDALVAAAMKTPGDSAISMLASLAVVGDWTSILKNIKGPVMDAYTPDTEPTAALLQRTLPGARMERFGDDGHALFVDDAKRFNRILKEFANVVSGRAEVIPAEN